MPDRGATAVRDEEQHCEACLYLNAGDLVGQTFSPANRFLTASNGAGADMAGKKVQTAEWKKIPMDPKFQPRQRLRAR